MSNKGGSMTIRLVDRQIIVNVNTVFARIVVEGKTEREGSD